MLNQAEINFYGFNQNNIIMRQSRGRVNVVICYDSKTRLYVVTRRTPAKIWQDRYSSFLEAKERFKVFLYYTSKQINEAYVKWGYNK